MSNTEAERVATIITFSQLPKNVKQMDFDHIVIDASLREYLGYQIPEDKVLLDSKGKAKKVQQDKVGVSPLKSIPEKASAKKEPAKKDVGKPSKAAPQLRYTVVVKAKMVMAAKAVRSTVSKVPREAVPENPKEAVSKIPIASTPIPSSSRDVTEPAREVETPVRHSSAELVDSGVPVDPQASPQNKTLTGKKRQASDKGKAKVDETSKRPRSFAEMNEHQLNLLGDSEASYVHSRIIVLEKPISTDDTPPPRVVEAVSITILH